MKEVSHTEDKIKVLYLHAGAELYGADKILLELVSNLDNTIFEPHVVLPNDGPLVKKLIDRNIQVSIIDYPILRRKYFNVRGIMKYIRQYKKSTKDLLDYSKKNGINIIHVNTTAVLEGIRLKRTLKIPMIWHVHEIILSPKIIYKATSFLIGRYADKIVAVSNAVRNHLLDSNYVKSDKIVTIYNGIDGEKFDVNFSRELEKSLGFSTDEIVIGMIGRINSWKGQEDFIKVVKPFGEYTNVKFLLVGGVFEGEEWRREKLYDLIDKSGLSSKTVLIDFQENIRDYYQLIDIFVLPSINPDPFPTVVLEAMASSKPITGYNHGGIVEMVASTELLAKPRNTDDLSKKIELLLNDETLRVSEGKKNKDRQMTLFNINKYAKNFEKVYIDELK